jgi:DNA gyrase subunit B
MSNEYTTDKIIKLSEYETVRKNPEMYIGSIENPTQLIDELLDNAIDEVLAGYATELCINLNTIDGVYSVSDNARGFPYNMKLPPEKDSPVLVCTELHTSGKFNKKSDDSPYKIAAGKHGVGLTVVNFLSTFLSIEIQKKTKTAVYKFVNGHFEGRAYEKNQNNKFSTRITIVPDPSIFDDVKVNVDSIKNRLTILKMHFPTLNIHLIIDNRVEEISGNINSFLADNLNDSKEIDRCIGISANYESDYGLVKFFWDYESSPTPKFLTIVNMISVSSGSHITKFINIIKDYFESASKKLGFTFEGKDVIPHLRCYMDLRLTDTSFKAQVKTTLGNKTDLSVFNVVEIQIKKYFANDKEMLYKICTDIEAYKSGKDSKKITGKRSSKRLFNKFTKLVDCECEGGELIIGEGDSAINGLINERDSKKHAALPLRGVVPNAAATKRQDLLNNTEVKDLIAAIGTGIGSEFNISKLRYDKIIIATDADPAGWLISSLLIVFFVTVLPELIKHKKIYVCKTPLFGYKDKTGKFIPLWNEEEILKVKSKYKILRFKGLGEFDPKDLKTFILDEKSRILQRIGWSEDYGKLIQLFKKSDERKQLIFDSRID